MVKAKTKGSLFDLLANAKGFVAQSILSPLFMIGEVVLEVFIPKTMAGIVNLLQAGDIPLMKDILTQGLYMVLMAAGSLICGMLSAYFAAAASVGFSKNLRRSLFYKIQDFSFGNIDKFSTASLVTRCTTDVSNVQMAYMQLIRTLVRSPLMFVMATLMAFNMNGELAIVFAVAIPLIVLTAAITLSKAFPRFRKMLQGYDELNGKVQENLINIRVVKSFVREDHEKETFAENINRLMGWSISAERMMVLLMPVMQLIMYGCKLAIVGFGGALVIKGGLKVGDLSAMITYAVQMLNSLLMLAMMAATFVTSKASIGRICEVLNTRSEMENGSDKETPADGSIVFDNVNFSYANDEDKLILKNINLKINSGETVGVISGTGEGKSTLVQLIPRLYDVDGGAVMVGGKDVRSYDYGTLRDAVSMVLQKNVLFSGTIAENMRWGDVNATDGQVVDACKKACAHDFIMSFPNGYDTVLGQGGVNLSGGQKQRLCIARALLKNPKIIIMDDSTSAVDTKTDEKIRETFANELPDVTKIIIAQRIASVSSADKIVVLDKGEIVDVGSHKELLQRSEIYREVYTSQSKEV